MHELRRIDLNLLLTLHALLTERHVTRAALRLNKSQPAVSHALAQLRERFQDPLLVRQGSRMALTPRAQALRQPLEAALGQLDGLLRDDGFDPSQSARKFRVAMSDYAADLCLPTLLRALRQHAPGVDLAICQASRESMLAQLEDGDIDLALGVFPSPRRDLLVRPLFKERFLCAADASSLPPEGDLTLDAWLARPHVLVATQAGGINEIDAALQARGLQRRIALVLPHWRTAPDVLPGTDLILTVAQRALPPQHAALRRFHPPLPLPNFDFQYAWHARRDGDPAHQWLRELLHACFSATAVPAKLASDSASRAS